VIEAESDYYPWGGELQFVNNDSNHYKFTGKERDSETGLDYYGAQYYANGLGRWASADWSASPVPVPYAKFSDPQSLNLYSYVRGIPTSQFDIDGHDPQRERAPAEEAAQEEAIRERDKEKDPESEPKPDPLVKAAEDLEKEKDQDFRDTFNSQHPGGYDDPVTGTCNVGPLTPEGQAKIREELGNLGKTNLDKSFDKARDEAFKNAGMTDPADVKFTRVDPKTGTVVEFKGPDGASVRYDKPHTETPGPAHDQPHVSWQSGGKVSEGGRQRGNIPYGGQQHPPSGGRGVGDVEPH
jgi:RHS repeat-associated protein